MTGNRREFLGASVAATAALALGAAPTRRPNLLWIVSEDNSARWLGCYGNPIARTPRLDGLAREGVRFTRCFANAPVCAPARNTLHTGIHASSLGCEHMRSRMPLPPDVRFFTHHLRDAGYFCLNGDKTDYNVERVPPGAWDARDQRLSWRLAPPGRPFFAFINLYSTHESSLHRDFEPETDPAAVRLPPRHPDIPEMRRDYARYNDRIALMDRQVGEILDRLERDGRADNTIVFYFSDNGGIMPGAKRFLNDEGTHVPLIVRAPERWRHLLPAAPGESCDQVVSYVDFAPSVLAAAGLPAPAVMQGHAFLGPDGLRGAPQQYAHCFRGRMDEVYDCCRSVHDGRYNYIRNYLPHRPAGRRLDYLWKMPSMRAWEREWQVGRLNDLQSAFFRPRPAEELYDLDSDPDETVNLAGHPDHAVTLDRLRAENLSHLRAVADLGLIPEAERVRRSNGRSPREIIRDGLDRDAVTAAAELCGRGDSGRDAMAASLANSEAVIRYWGAVGLAALGGDARIPAAPALAAALDDPSPSVRIAVGEALAVTDEDRARRILAGLLYHDELFVALEAIDAMAACGFTLTEAEQDRRRRIKADLTRATSLGALL